MNYYSKYIKYKLKYMDLVGGFLAPLNESHIKYINDYPSFQQAIEEEMKSENYQIMLRLHKINKDPKYIFLVNMFRHLGLSEKELKKFDTEAIKKLIKDNYLLNKLKRIKQIQTKYKYNPHDITNIGKKNMRSGADFEKQVETSMKKAGYKYLTNINLIDTVNKPGLIVLSSYLEVIKKYNYNCHPKGEIDGLIMSNNKVKTLVEIKRNAGLIHKDICKFHFLLDILKDKDTVYANKQFNQESFSNITHENNMMYILDDADSIPTIGTHVIRKLASYTLYRKKEKIMKKLYKKFLKMDNSTFEKHIIPFLKNNQIVNL